MFTKKRENEKLYVCVGFLCIFIGLLLCTQMEIYADVGNNHRYGGDSGGSSSGGSSYGGSGGGGDSFFLFYMFSNLFRMFGPTGLIVFGLVLLGVAIFMRKKGISLARGYATHTEPLNPQTYFDNENDIIKSIVVQDPDFSAEEFKQFASECFVTLQAAWTARDWSAIRPFETETLFNMHNQQLQEYVQNHTINVIERVNVQSTRIISHAIQGDKEVVGVAMRVVMRDYIIDEKTRQVVEGNRLKDFYTNYRLEFIRVNGVKTVSGKSMSAKNCPNCGAPVQITSSGRCEYCDSLITTGDFSWVLNELTTI